MVRIKATHDGTYTVYRERQALLFGLTRTQAEAFARSLGEEPRDG
jgi:hypothetical protein